MEKKTKHRIIGILVVIGLVIISLPLFRAGSDEMPDTAVVKAPPFPDQAMQAMATEESSDSDSEVITPRSPQSTASITTAPEAAQPEANDNVTPPQPAAMNTTSDASAPAAEKTIADVTTDMIPQDSPQVVEDKALDAVTDDGVEANKIAVVTPEASPVKKAAHKNTVKAKKSVVPATHMTQHHFKTPVDNDSNGLLKLKGPVWVIQVGSFKSKVNAMQLVNRLRANGYPAFIQQAAPNTRVFVGPENKQSSARTLADQLNTKLKIRGIVISYKPFTF